MSRNNGRMMRAKAMVETSPKLKRLYEAFREGMHMSEEEALAAALGPQFDEPADLMSLVGGNHR